MTTNPECEHEAEQLLYSESGTLVASRCAICGNLAPKYGLHMKMNWSSIKITHEPTIWLFFAKDALGGTSSYLNHEPSEKLLASHAANIADQMLEEYKKRFK